MSGVDGSSTLVVSVLPRGSSVGGSALVALDARSLQPLSVRPIAPAEYLEVPDDESFAVEHCRGLAVCGRDLRVALFNSVRSYRIDDPRKLELTPGLRLTHRQAADIHGIAIAGGRLYAASTATDSVVSWPLGSGRTRVVELGDPEVRDLRFPMKAARVAGHGDWRHVMRAQLHLNDVCVHEGAIYACGLHRVIRVDIGGRPRTILKDAAALFHDGHPDPDGLLVFTDAARGQLLRVDPETGHAIRIPVVDSNRRFLRGVCILGNHVAVLHSDHVASHQRHPWRASPTESHGAEFGVSVLDLRSGAVELDRAINVSELASGSVAYAAVVLPAVPAGTRSTSCEGQSASPSPEFAISPGRNLN